MHEVCRPFFFAPAKAGGSNAASMAMVAITTKSSIEVNPGSSLQPVDLSKRHPSIFKLRQPGIFSSQSIDNLARFAPFHFTRVAQP